MISRCMTNERHLLSVPGAVAASLCVMVLASAASGQTTSSSATVTSVADGQTRSESAESSADSLDVMNPISIIRSAGQALPNAGRSDVTGVSAGAATPPDTSEYPDGLRDGVSSPLSIMLILTVLSIAPAILILCTSFTRVVVVLALLRQAIGTQQLPPSQVIIGLSVFLTLLIMAPTFERINETAIVPLSNEQITEMEAWEAAKKPLREFMIAQIVNAGNTDDVVMILNYRGVDTSDLGALTWERDVDMLTLIPAFVLSELKIAFLIGFKLYLPFLIIDMVISSVLISMGMLMLPPVLISLPFKLLLFVLVDGWRLVAGNLLASFAIPGVTT